MQKSVICYTLFRNSTELFGQEQLRSELPGWRPRACSSAPVPCAAGWPLYWSGTQQELCGTARWLLPKSQEIPCTAHNRQCAFPILRKENHRADRRDNWTV